ncbi:hypothetical protein FNV43_RR09859 [Rhamnella rubrinervis]|uniref:Tetrapyrrole methylase domain-containing protein n=1 Tax=Rhamnella rubrinervis TaxID=2594499 RepID=A0A8K0HAR0_9ROSA|nr:hypothetical protein FNV43_RR09859 [Rhamnella rubrinervis]
MWAWQCVLGGYGARDSELMTLKAVKVIQNADLLLYDRLVSNDVLDLVGPDAKLLYVGKTAGYHSRTQEEIHELLLSFAEAGATVVRLKGGIHWCLGGWGRDGFSAAARHSSKSYSRKVIVLKEAGAEMKHYFLLGNNDSPLKLVSRRKFSAGITAASGIAAELGIPLTHRGIANSVRFLTGHSRKGGTDPLFVAENAADPDTTLVVYMGLSTLPSLAQMLMHHGLPSNTPAVAVERGTTPQERMNLLGRFCELKDLADKIVLVELV